MSKLVSLSEHPASPPKTELSKPAAKFAKRRAIRPYLILAPALLLTVGILIPFFSAIYLSFTDFTLRSSSYTLIGFDNYTSMFQNPDFWHSLTVTLEYAVICTTVEMLVGIGIALLLNEDNPLSRFLRIVLIFPLMIAPVIGTLIWKLMTNPSVGILAGPMRLIGLGDFKWGAAPDTAMFSLILVDAWVYTPFVIILVLAGLRSLPKSPYEAALIDGGSPWFVFRNLTLPMLAPVLLITLVFRLMLSLQEFSIIFALTEGGPGDTTMSLSLLAYNRGFPFYDVAEAIPIMLFLWAAVYLISFILIGFWRKAQARAAGVA
ncbi:MAG: sugar ABC transporter permease [Verrucomicrobia bacterium]|nr:sugar ABC transporter permease [Verrucomicrobiota bacterium]MBV9673232.1 sugar ABC transporter permease [Verrucomicrobiota bacterium]